MPVRIHFKASTMSLTSRKATAPLRPDRRALLAAMTATGIAFGQPGHAASPDGPAVGQRLAVPPMDLLSGGRFDPGAAEGRALILYWWASWCPFCALQSPHMQTLWEQHKARGLRMLALSIDRTADDALGYWQRKGYSFPIALVTPAIARALPKPKGLPALVVRGKDGRVAQVESGQLFPEDVEQLARFV